jgi:hypothetical protein
MAQLSAETWERERKVMAKSEESEGELFPRIGFIVTNSKLPVGKGIQGIQGALL